MKYLKNIRVGLALFFIIATTTLFFELSFLLESNWATSLLSFQFVPSFLKLIRGVSFIAIGFVGFTLLSFILGRWYCSFVCPLGILQDVFIRINKTLFKKRRLKFRYKNSIPWLKHVILVLAILFIVFGSTTIFILLDPYSNYGRIATHIFQPIFLFLNNVTAFIFNKFDNYSVYHIELKAFDLMSFFFAFGIVVLLLWLTNKRGRLFCNTLCPVGAFLSKTSSISLFKLKFVESKCISCSKCEKECKAESIDYKKMQIDFDRCIACFNCVDTCSKKAITYQFVKTKKSKPTDAAKRNSLKTVFAALTALSGLALKIDSESFSSFKSKKPAKSKFPVAPPGAISLEYYKDTCTACHLCISACPTKVIQSTFTEFGIDSMFIPRMNYDVQYCQFECTLCNQICPTGALKPLKLDAKKVTQIGKVTFVKGNCVVSQLEKDCGACAEHCPTKAVKMIPYKGKTDKKLFIPEVDTDLCIGCGACEHPCPVRPHKAIFVESSVNHALAKKPVITSEKQKVQVDEEFPF